MKVELADSRTKRGVEVFNATFNNISVISCQSVYWWWKLEYHAGENHLSVPSH
jgi:hypothetical protein